MNIAGFRSTELEEGLARFAGGSVAVLRQYRHFLW
jgi:hypothetical protein